MDKEIKKSILAVCTLGLSACDWDIILGNAKTKEDGAAGVILIIFQICLNLIVFCTLNWLWHIGKLIFYGIRTIVDRNTK